ncbi:MAG: hypothetical protein CL840_11310 [Crocinitomicaceae bacterium]|nr:hypothetical protein [Crocinitomicaceae bacterium]|tara:strand:- start:9833 stop:10339 length:507 start_codon:yes stop_codon:yes gene_type:complete
MKLVLSIVFLNSIFCFTDPLQPLETKTITKNQMIINWYHQKDRVFFELSAPTTGWLAIGFNQSSGLTRTYLIMGNVVKGETSVVEHYTESPGNYSPISSYGDKNRVDNVNGSEIEGKTSIKFSVPVRALYKYHKDLDKGLDYTMLIAYSREDDFQHHSIMRSSVSIKL